MIRNVELFDLAKNLRQKGKSYSSIRRELGLAKSTLSTWFSKSEWSKRTKESLIQKNRQSNIERLVAMNKAKHLRKIKRDEEFRQQARLEYTSLKASRLFIAGLSIYWGEGEKSENGRVSVINTDAEMIQIIVKFYREILHIPESDLRGALFLYKDIDRQEAVKYWSETTEIPKNQFIKTQLIPSRSSLTKRKVKNGICCVYFSSTEKHIKIREWIRLLSSDMRV